MSASRSSLFLFAALAGCQTTQTNPPAGNAAVLQPLFRTETTAHDSDDPAIWVHPVHPDSSLILGTDKDEQGGLYVFDLQGNIIREKVITGLRRPNNVDIEYGVKLNGETIDIAVVTERLEERLRIFRLPDMSPVDGGGLAVFAGEANEEFRAPMGVAVYKRPHDGALFCLVSRKNGPRDGYLWQYALAEEGGQFTLTFVRSLGQFSGDKEIEAICVDDAMGRAYYSDESFGIRAYHADPDSGGQELMQFGLGNFSEDREGISLYATGDSSGYLLVSDQQASRFHVFDRKHPDAGAIATLPMAVVESDGSEACSLPLGSRFPKGMFVAMSDDKTFQVYRWEELEAEIERQAPQARGK